MSKRPKDKLEKAERLSNFALVFSTVCLVLQMGIYWFANLNEAQLKTIAEWLANLVRPFLC